MVGRGSVIGNLRLLYMLHSRQRLACHRRHDIVANTATRSALHHIIDQRSKQAQGTTEQRIPGNLNISFAFVEGEGLMMGVKGLAVSSGSACTSASLEPSYVLRALGVDVEMAHTSLRFGLGRFTTEADIDYAIDHVVEAVTHLREMSPLWEMHLAGVDLKSIEWADH